VEGQLSVDTVPVGLVRRPVVTVRVVEVGVLA
jgi:hypothetical protein